MARRALVTGGAGFIGSHMADRLVADGWDVVVVDNEFTGKRENVPARATYVKGDVSVRAELAPAFAKPLDAVFHIAGRASTIQSFLDPTADMQTNVQGTINVIQECLAHKVPRLLYASSMTTYGHPAKIPVPIDAPLLPVSYYGITKCAAERYVHATAERNDLDFDFAATSFRMFNVYGPRQSLTNPYQGVVGIFLGNVLAGARITIHSDGEQSRDFVYVADVVDAWVGAVDNPAARNRVFNLGTGSRRSVNELVDAVLAGLGRSRKDWEVVHTPVRPGDQRHMEADITRTREALGWAPKVDFTEGMRRTVLWAKEDHARGGK
jgi:UDP-glucose 4-epimerase